MAMLPSNYAWLSKEKAPRLLLEALKLYGTAEIPGKQHSPAIMRWLKKLLFTWITDDEKPWCGTAMAEAAVNAGVAVRNSEMPRAFWWEDWGRPSPNGIPMLGDVLVFNFSHVGVYVGEDATHYHTLGGNQGNTYSIARFPKSSLRAARRTAWQIGQPANVRRIWLTPQGVPTSPSTR